MSEEKESFQKAKAFVDGHVHLQQEFDPLALIRASLQNFTAVASQDRDQHPLVFYLFLCETDGTRQFERLVEAVFSSKMAVHVVATRERDTLFLSFPDVSLCIVRGKQIVTKEKLEILTFGGHGGSFCRQPLEQVLASLEASGESLNILPWGVGKWIGARGALVQKVVAGKKAGERAAFFLGDNGNRPWFWPLSKIFAEGLPKGVVNLPGSDPLAFAHHERRAGSYGFRLVMEFERETPFKSLRRKIMTAPETISRFGRPSPAGRFFYDQITLQLRKRRIFC